jgi:hypothetical protein
MHAGNQMREKLRKGHRAMESINLEVLARRRNAEVEVTVLYHLGSSLMVEPKAL